jgi:putative hemolysin
MLRTANLVRELMNKRGGTFHVRLGEPIQAATLGEYGDPAKATDYLRARTYLLGHRRSSAPAAKLRHMPPVSVSQPVAPSSDPDLIRAEIDHLDAMGARLLDHREYRVYLASGSAMTAIRHEIGRLRELTFRTVGEGAGHPLDVDRFDSYYQHLILWDKARNAIAGGYRLAWTNDVLPERGVDGLYTSTLFRYRPDFFHRVGPALELGRSFIVPERQKEYAPLLLLWQGIARAVAARPDCPVLFGAVSISRDYCTGSREIMVRFLNRRRRRDLAAHAVPRRPIKMRLTRREEIDVIAGMFDDIDDLSGPIRDIEAGSGVPVLLRQYLKLGGEIISFNMDRNFSDVIDCLLLVDLRTTDRKVLVKYMGPVVSAGFFDYWSARRGVSA